MTGGRNDECGPVDAAQPCSASVLPAPEAKARRQIRSAIVQCSPTCAIQMRQRLSARRLCRRRCRLNADLHLRKAATQHVHVCRSIHDAGPANLSGQERNATIPDAPISGEQVFSADSTLPDLPTSTRITNQIKYQQSLVKFMSNCIAFLIRVSSCPRRSWQSVRPVRRP